MLGKKACCGGLNGVAMQDTSSQFRNIDCGMNPNIEIISVLSFRNPKSEIRIPKLIH
ncbi:MAG: hypothetical protein MAG551_00362 [Candidatus Scalindua arabica]|uniref:Uncharacterized protein n=1 Tax=Candidatus Scalindua arabica TaxID=1127984 RepID=A0A941W3I0_9BACT|nr:hypothetical protein [Candidatus Scalindua arabica]